MIEAYSPKPETCHKISTKFNEIMILLAEATEELYFDLPPEIRKHDLRPVIYKTQLFDFITNMTEKGQFVYEEYAKLLDKY